MIPNNFQKKEQNKKAYEENKVYSVENRSNMTAEELMESIRNLIQQILKK